MQARTTYRMREGTSSARTTRMRIAIAILLAAGMVLAVAPSARAVEKGAPPHWGAGMGVGKYSVVDLRTGRVLTTLPVVGWDGTGPAISFSLYHNMTSAWGPPDGIIIDREIRTIGDANFDGTLDDNDISPFIDIMLDTAPTQEEIDICDFTGDQAVDASDLSMLVAALGSLTGDLLWTHSYSDRLDIALGTLTHVHADCSEDVYTAGPNGYTASPGVFNTLTVDDPPTNGYTLKSPAQNVMHFDQDGRLEWLADPSGNQVTCVYIDDSQSPADGKLDYVEDASGRQLDLVYNSHGELMKITDPVDREWTLLYYDDAEPENPKPDADGVFVAFEDARALSYRIAWTYTDFNEIATMTDKNGHTFTFAYTGGRLRTVTDPEPAPGQAGLSQTIQYYGTTTNQLETRFFDRRNERWTYRFDGATQNLLWIRDPLYHTQHFGYDDPNPELMHERTSYTNALGKTWTLELTLTGAVRAVTDPLGNRWWYGYGALNNLTGMLPPAEGLPGGSNFDKQVSYLYADPAHPTSPTSIVLPDDGQGNPAATITMTYYNGDVPGEEQWHGLLKMVTDANGVETLFEYDEYGQQWRWTEGALGQEDWDKVTASAFPDAVGRIQSSLWNYTGGYPEEGGGGRSCVKGGCIEFDSIFSIKFCCCCALICEGHTYCHKPDADNPCGGEGGDEGEGDPPDGSRLNSNWCLPFGAIGSMEGPAHFDYDGVGQMIGVDSEYFDASLWTEPMFHVDATMAYDELGRLTSLTHSTDEPTWETQQSGSQIDRYFNYTYNDAAGTFDRDGPDGQATHAEVDSAGRVQSITREGMSVNYTYYSNNAVHTATNGNGSRTVYSYYDNGRPQQIRHEWAGDQSLILQLDYTYFADGLVHTITETGPDGPAAVTTFAYDNRNRLIEEERIGTGSSPVSYHMLYTYDQGGNRLAKRDELANIDTIYHYDVDDAGVTYETLNNRLMYYEVYENMTLLERRDYEYDNRGNAMYIVRKLESEPVYHGYTLQYNNQNEVWFVTEQTWTLDEFGYCENPQTVSITEFRGNGRTRYMVRERNPAFALDVLSGTTRWSDYDGDEIYGDYIVDDVTGVLTETMAYLPGVAQMDSQTGEIVYFHGDQIGSLRTVSDQQSAVIGTMVYTAFGEQVYADGTVGTRYQYAGAWGYETSNRTDVLAELGWQHVGHRYYDPSTGRFLQRDPIAIRGGLNVYEYVRSKPILAVDPLGLWDCFEAVKWGVASCLITALSGGSAVVIAGAGAIGTVAGGLEQKDVVSFYDSTQFWIRYELLVWREKLRLSRKFIDDWGWTLLEFPPYRFIFNRAK